MFEKIRTVLSDIKREFKAGRHEEDLTVVEGEVLSVTYEDEEPSYGSR